MINSRTPDLTIAPCGADEKYVFRIYRANWRSRNDIAYEVDALADMRKEDVAVSQALRRRDGDYLCTFEAPEGARNAVLFTFAPGKELSYDKEGDVWPLDTAGAPRKFTMRWKRFRLRINALLWT